MKISNRREPFILFVGDIFFFTLALIISLFLRFWRFPDQDLFIAHFVPFSAIFLLSVIIFFIAGLYEKHTVILKSRLSNIIFQAEFINSVIAVLFFYFIPYFGITPKVSLFIYVLVSFGLIVFWRLYLSSFFITKRSEKAVIIGTGREMGELFEEVNKNIHYGIVFSAAFDVQKETSADIEEKIKKILEPGDISLVVVDLEHDNIQPIMPKLYALIFSRVRFVSMNSVYEDVFRRVPFSILHYDWFLENISASPKALYDAVKRTTDIILSLVAGVMSLVVYPFVYAAIKIEDNGPVFIIQDRIGKGGKRIKIAKFRSMKTSDRGIWVKEKDDRITRVGAFLRKTRIDELPQLWNVLWGDISLIGPRPDVYDLGIELSSAIPYYTVRSTIKPGLSGWAQVNQDLPPQSLEETKLRLAYDLYYVKNRSIMLDTIIILKTIRTLLSRSGK